MRSKPGVTDDSIRLEPLLWRGAVVFVLGGPVEASGYTWFQVRPIGEADLQVHSDPPPLGWVAAADKNGDPWLAPHPVPCGESVPFDLLFEIDHPPHGLVGLACFGNRTLRFDAILVKGLGDCDGTLEPAWLNPCLGGRALAAPGRAPGDERRLVVALDPSIDANALPLPDAAAEVPVTVAGQWDHPAARTCRLEPDAANPPSELVVLGCRAQFVVTSITRR